MATKKELLLRRKQLLLQRKAALSSSEQADPTFRERLQRFGEGVQDINVKGQELLEPVQPFLQALRQAEQFSTERLEQTSPLISASLKARDQVKKAFDVGGDVVTEQLAERFPTLPPEIPALAGTGVAITDDLVEAILGAKGARGAGAGKARFSSKAIGKEIGEAERVAGIADIQVVTRDLAKRLGLPKSKQTFSHVANEIERKLKAGDPVSTQDLADFRIKADSVFNEAAFKKGKPRAILTRQKKLVDREFNKRIPGREDPSRRLAQLKGLQRTLGLGALGSAVEFGRRKLLNLFGGR